MDLAPALDLVFVIYVSSLGLCGLWGLHRLVLLWRFRWEAARPASALARGAPCVTVQLPLYDERTVAARAIRALGDLAWPRERLEIQVLDDSTDETREIVEREVAALAQRGIDVSLLRRAERSGFKAGALAAGMLSAKGELLCVFDADFVPPADFLERLVPRFADPRVGMVQARWIHTNRGDSLFTRAQATLLDGHFVIEHTARAAARLFFNFNGTAGIWRRAAIETVGGWQHDTLTEDLDLSYRSQLAGWRFVYAPDVEAPAEVPADIAAFKSQQGRWARGSVQVLRKLGLPILASREPARIKLEAFAHLTGNAGYPSVLVLAALLPLVAMRQESLQAWHVGAFLVCTLTPFLFYERSQRALGRPLGLRLVDSAAALVLGIGMSLSQTRAVMGGLGPRVGTFVRTPKRGDGSQPRYRAQRTALPGAELLVAAWFAGGIACAARLGSWAALPFLILFLAGFAWVGTLSLREALRARAC